MIRECQLPALEDGYSIPPSAPKRHLKPRPQTQSAVQKMILQAKYGQSVVASNFQVQSFTHAAKHLGIETRKQIISGRGASRVNRVWFLPDEKAASKTDQNHSDETIKNLRQENWKLHRALKQVVNSAQDLKKFIAAAEGVLNEHPKEVTLIKARVKKLKSTIHDDSKKTA